MFIDRILRTRKLRQELAGVRAQIPLKQKRVAELQREKRVAWGKRWAYTHMVRRRQQAESGTAAGTLTDGQAQVLEMRRRQVLAELRQEEGELEGLVERESKLCAELGEPPQFSRAVGEHAGRPGKGG